MDKIKPFIKQDEGTCLFLRATCQFCLIICSYFNEDGVDWRSRYSACQRSSCKGTLPLQAQSCVGSIASRKNCEACENLAIPVGSVERRTFTFEQQSAQLDFIVRENKFLIWYETIIIIVDQKLSNLFQGTHSQTFNKVKKSLWPSPLLKLKACFSRQVDVVPPQPVAAKVTVLYVAVHLNLRSVVSYFTPLNYSRSLLLRYGKIDRAPLRRCKL